MKKIWAIFLIVIIATATAVAQKSHSVRVTKDFNNNWKFKLEDKASFCEIAYDDSQWRVLTLPHDWSVGANFSKENSGRNAWLPGGIAWYRKSFVLPNNYKGKSIEIQFDGVYKNATLWVNQHPIGIQHDGYTSFRYDITELLSFEQENTIAVRVDNSNQPNCRWYSGSGIYRNVWLNVTSPTHIETWGTFITTPEVSEEEAKVKIVSTLKNMDEAKEVNIETLIYAPNGKQVAIETSAIKIGNYQSTDISLFLSVKAPELWSVATPEIYRVITYIKSGNEILDEYESTFGIRTIEFDAEKGFFLNGENIKMKGVCLHHDAGSLGGAVPDEVWIRRLRKLKAIGCNAIRTAHNPASPEFMTMCDTMGFLVMNEFVDKWNKPYRKNAPKDPFYNVQMADPNFTVEWQQNYEQTIRRDRNHPSVIIWSVGNENHPAGSIGQNDGLRRYASFVRSLDPSRPVISGMERGKDVKNVDKKVDDIIESCKYMDLIGMNYGEQWCSALADKKPGKAFVSTESYRYYNSTPLKRYANVERSPWLDVIDNENNMGLFLWPGIAYLGESRNWGRIGSDGVFDFAGFPNPDAYLYKAFWSEEPTVHLEVYGKKTEKMSQWGIPEMHQNWNLPKDTIVNLVTYTNCETVDLYLNNKKIGSQNLSDFPNWIMNWQNVNYQPGILKAVGKINGKAVCECEIATVGKLHHLEMNADKSQVKSGDIIHVELSLHDKKGRGITNADGELHFKLEGNAQIIALENGNSSDLTPFSNKKTKMTHKGRCLCIVKVGDNKNEEVKLSVKCTGINTQQLVLIEKK
ncbi:glycoside hydrolase family 2 TIM barrel-domain containing protein [Carboxylicivirga marina]|uniref:DUF4982 domain-containing protein n=1 Tax=Carboxylicivirga marina TaxID=2800988 RepID=A0ABS1HHJ6_9BACT|nr:glycoside hydrolase family 2 TIM barrel-domain containing protein [Carboxylicivirga marina]MBK3517091.1 DUF4982 domain-containing protein [Carboxylicivirga marina]